MIDILKEVINIDKQAREHVEEAYEYKKRELAKLEKEKEAVFKQELDKITKAAEEVSNENKLKNEDEINSITEKNSKIEQSMNDINNEKFDYWVNNIFNNIINN